MPNGKGYYDESDAEEILRIAAKRTSGVGGMSRDQLLATASELGISPDAIAEAEAEYVVRKEEQSARCIYDKEVKSDFWGHVVTYAIINSALMGFNFIGSGRISWALWPLLGWGIAIAFHAWEAFAKSSEDYEKGFERWRRRRERRARKSRASRVYGVHVGKVDLDDEDEDVEQTMRDIARSLDPATQKIEAIRELRNRTGLELKDAKDVVDEYVRLNRG